MMRARERISPKEKKKPRTRYVEDRRPYISYLKPGWKTGRGACRRWAVEPRWIRHDEKDAESGPVPIFLEYPNGKPKRDPPKWSHQDILILIDFYASISWGIGSNRHQDMLGHWREFKRAYIRQEGKCAITQLPIFGGPSLGPNGIGIDFISYKRGAKKNVRLTTPTIALTRYRRPVVREPNYGFPFEERDFEGQPITYIIFKTFQREIIKQNPLCHLPIVAFISTFDEKYNELNFEYVLLETKTRDKPSIDDFKSLKTEHNTFCRFRIQDDKLYLTKWKVPFHRPTFYPNDKEETRIIRLADPIDIIAEMYKWLVEAASSAIVA